jgi:hypothetical protein
VIPGKRLSLYPLEDDRHVYKVTVKTGDREGAHCPPVRVTLALHGELMASNEFE